jgi:hypothetical protein
MSGICGADHERGEPRASAGGRPQRGGSCPAEHARPRLPHRHRRGPAPPVGRHGTFRDAEHREVFTTRICLALRRARPAVASWAGPAGAWSGRTGTGCHEPGFGLAEQIRSELKTSACHVPSRAGTNPHVRRHATALDVTSNHAASTFTPKRSLGSIPVSPTNVSAGQTPVRGKHLFSVPATCQTLAAQFRQVHQPDWPD